MWQVYLPIGITLAGAVLTFAVKEPRIFLRLAPGLNILIHSLAVLCTAFYVGMQHAISIAHATLLPLIGASEDQAKGAAKVTDAIREASDWGGIAILVYVSTSIVGAGAAYLAKEIKADREENAQKPGSSPEG